MKIEGHTKDIGSGEPEFWQSLAEHRAALCATTLGEMGVESSMLSSIGLPGTRGNNRVEVVVKLDIIDEDEAVPNE
jgi:hypothetical protein